MKRLFVFAAVAMLPLLAFAGKAKVLKIDFDNPIAERNTGSSFDIMAMVKGTSSPVFAELKELGVFQLQMCDN